MKVIEHHKTEPYKTIKSSELPDFWQRLKNTVMEPETLLLIEWQLLTMTRPNEACGTCWDEIDLENRLWTIPAERMKGKREHQVALSTQAVSILNKMKDYSLGQKYVFMSPRKTHRHIQRGTIGNVLNRAGGDIVPHGFRALASTTLNEQGFNPDVIEAALAHVGSNVVRNAYNRSTYLEQRYKLMQWWGILLTGLRGGAIQPLVPCHWCASLLNSRLPEGLTMPINQTNAVGKACQLASLLLAINCSDDPVSEFDKANLFDLAIDMSNQIVNYLVSVEASQEKLAMSDIYHHTIVSHQILCEMSGEELSSLSSCSEAAFMPSPKGLYQ